MLHLFEVWRPATMWRRVKPDPELYLLAAERLGLRPGECIAIEDSLNGATAAVAAGTHAAGRAQRRDPHPALSPHLAAPGRIRGRIGGSGSGGGWGSFDFLRTAIPRCVPCLSFTPA